ncbi:hypothetical protein [Acaryochloris sp. CCMEE 5410]|uniref:hypothetical protein n=1 Tax=Acaryochloris sp. CCMEE 5410 TaxID=310037 RepID=UPI00024847EB|nr:hypothetical protein [Acaryochloris sp. CCMEE 5410]KAI9131247.1 hypothetical protein ON05_026735 [Acaryochloris sp. CCMEE 5410]
MNSLVQRQIAFNLNSSNAWEAFSSHRSQVTWLLKHDTDPSRLCILGAGNCNDLDLTTLLQSHQEIHLVDIDLDALAQGVAKQNLANQGHIHLHGGIDLTGMLDLMSHWSPKVTLSKTDIAACIDAPTHCLEQLPGPFDGVASTCLLSQLIKSIVDTIGEDHPQFVTVIQAIRLGHLRLLLKLMNPGGFGVLITDVVSSDSYPPLPTVPTQNLSQVLVQLVRQGNFFHGVNPAAIVNLFRQDPVLSKQVASLEPVGPWRWNFGPRHYAVIAVKFQKK